MSARNDLPAVSASNFEQRVRETLQTYLGRQGDPLDRGLTLRDFVENGILKLPDGWTLRNGAGSLPLLPGNALLDPSDLTPPPTPTGFTGTGGISYVFVQHDNPVYLTGGGHLRTRLYGATRVAGAPAPVFADAVEIAQFTGVTYSHTTNPATTWHLWIKWESVAGVLSVSPAGGTNGVVVTTGQDVSKLLEALTGQITQSQLFADLSTRINLIDAAANVAGSVNARLLTEANTRAAELLAEANARIAADTSLGSSITTLQNTTSSQATSITNLTTRVTSAESSITTLNQTTASQASSLTNLTTRVTSAESSITTLNQTTSSQASSLTALTTRVTNAESSISTLNTTTSSQATSLTSLTTRVGTAETNITNLQTTTSSQASSISTLTSSVNSNTTSIQTLTSTTNGLSAQYTVKIDNNGYVTGYGLASTVVNGTPTSSFIVRADTFSVAAAGQSTLVPFIVRTSPTTINGVSVPAGVYINGAFIQGGSIQGASIAGGTIENTKLINVSADKITGAALLSTSFIESAGYVAGTSGWKINGNGTAEFAAASIRGKLTAAQIDVLGEANIGPATITSAKIASTIQSDNYASGSAGWRINRSGTAEFYNISLRGLITSGAALATQVQVGTGVGGQSDHHGISLSGSNYNNCFIRRDSDGAIFFNLNSGGTNALSFNTVSGILQVRGDIEATSIRANTIAVATANIANLAVSETYVAVSSQFGASVTINIPSNASSVVAMAGLGSASYTDPGQGGFTRVPLTGTITLFGGDTAGAGTIVTAAGSPPAGTYTVSASRFFPGSGYVLEGNLVLVVTVNKR